MPIYEHNPYESVGRCKQLGGLFERRAARGSSRSFQGGSAPLPFKFGGLEPPSLPPWFLRPCGGESGNHSLMIRLV